MATTTTPPDGITQVTAQYEARKTSGATPETDTSTNGNTQLTHAAAFLMIKNPAKMQLEINCPDGWDVPTWKKYCAMSYTDRLALAGAFIAAEIDRALYVESQKTASPAANS